MSASDRERLVELNDARLRPLIDAPDECARDLALEALVRGVTPLVETILKRFARLERNVQPDDVEELVSAVTMRFVRKMHTAALYEEHAVRNIEGYASQLAFNALHDFRRSRYPERHRLKRNLRYLLTRDRGLALWEIDDDAVAGLSTWRGQAPGTAGALPTRRSATPAMTNRDRPIEALRAVFHAIGHAVRFESLVDVAAELWDVRDVVVDSGDFPADARPDPLSTIEQREYLARLWSEVRALPENQRVALLLNLRDAGGSNALTLFLLLGVATHAELASILQVGEEELNRMWDELPFDDLTIAERLRLTRQQVINLRSAARMRLWRRMAKWK